MPELITRAEAREKGLKHYFTGEPCRHGHLDKRAVSNTHCSECSRIQARKDYHTHKTERSLQRKRYYESNKDKYIADVKAWSKLHPEHARAKRARRRAREAESSFKAQRQAVRDFYKATPKGMVVDHKIPLNHPSVCGLHVPWNLQYLTPEENRKKGNLFLNDLI